MTGMHIKEDLEETARIEAGDEGRVIPGAKRHTKKSCSQWWREENMLTLVL